MGLLCNSSADGGRMIAWLLGGLWNRVFSFSPTVARLSSCGLFVAKGRCGTKEHEQWLSEILQNTAFARSSKIRSFLSNYSSAKKKKKTFIFFSQPVYVMSFYLHLGPAAWSLSSDSFAFAPDSAARADLCLAAASVRVTAAVLQRLSRWTPRNPHRLLV